MRSTELVSMSGYIIRTATGLRIILETSAASTGKSAARISNGATGTAMTNSGVCTEHSMLTWETRREIIRNI